jgi:hypothetical protein
MTGKGSGMSIEDQVERLMADAKAADAESIKCLKEAWATYAECYCAPEETQTHHDIWHYEELRFDLETAICDVVGAPPPYWVRTAVGVGYMRYAPRAADALVTGVESLASAWDAWAHQRMSIADQSVHAAPWIALEKAVRDLVDVPGPAYWA